MRQIFVTGTMKNWDAARSPEDLSPIILFCYLIQAQNDEI